MLAKGLLEKSPSIVTPDRVDFVHNTDYLGNVLGFGNQRPLNALEISHIVTVMETKQILKGAIVEVNVPEGILHYQIINIM